MDGGREQAAGPLEGGARRGNLLVGLPRRAAEEVVEALAAGAHALVERIVSTGQATPPGAWLEQERDEWVALLQGEAELSFQGGEVLRLAAGDWVLIPGGLRHRVERTSGEPPCVWLAVHADLASGEVS